MLDPWVTLIAPKRLTLEECWTPSYPGYDPLPDLEPYICSFNVDLGQNADDLRDVD